MIEVKNVSKSFPGVKALDSVSFSINSGTVHGLVGENGAGKSTLIKIFAGIHEPDEGGLYFDGEQVQFKTVHDSQAYGIATIFQELTVIPELKVSENIFLGREPIKKAGFIDRKTLNGESTKVLESLNVPIHPNDLVEKLSIANRQVIEICKALVLNAKVIIMDEPTSSLTEHEIKELFHTIRNLKKQGMTVLYVSHKIEEIFEICDYVTVFRDGEHIDTVKKEDVGPPDIIKMMVGRSMNMLFPPREAKIGDVLFSVKGLSKTGEFEDVSFDLHEGEIVGFAGLIGAGRTELAKAVYGATQPDSGEIFLHRKPSKFFSHPNDALSKGIAYLSEDRKGEGLVLMLSVKENMALPIVDKLVKRIFIDEKKELELVNSYINKFRVKITSIDQIVNSLSGGNQQKVVISKLLLTESDVFIFDEPTRGIDVGAKYEIYKIMNDLTAEGKGIIFISSELPEILGISDRIMCMSEGRIAKEFTRDEAKPEKIMNVLTGGSEA